MLSLTHIWGPISDQRRYEWSASIAVDLVSRALMPHRFAEVVPGVTMVIGGREGIGRITDFFADDGRNPERRQTFTSRASADHAHRRGLHPPAEDGEVRNLDGDGAYSEISFDRYDLSLTLFSEDIQRWRPDQRLADPGGPDDRRLGRSSRNPRRANRRRPPGHRHLRRDRGDRRISRHRPAPVRGAAGAGGAGPRLPRARLHQRLRRQPSFSGRWSARF